jgi:hypothetical protein
MPSTSAKQHRFMEAIAHNKSFAKKVGVPQSVGKDFVEADKGKKFAAGGMGIIGKQNARHGKTDLPFTKLNRFAGMNAGGNVKESKAMVKKEVSFMKKKGAPASMIKHEAAEMGAMKKGGMMRPKKDIAADQMAMAPYKKGGAMARGGGIESKGKTKGTMIKMAAGGFVRQADGIAQRGKTKAMQVKMNKGGSC